MPGQRLKESSAGIYKSTWFLTYHTQDRSEAPKLQDKVFADSQRPHLWSAEQFPIAPRVRDVDLPGDSRTKLVGVRSSSGR